MKASRRCRVDIEQSSSPNIVIDDRIQQLPSVSPVEPPGATKDEPKQQPSPPSTPLPSNVDLSTGETVDHEGTVDEPKSSAPEERHLDPLRWFGILTPRELRSAQASFSSVMAKPLEQAVDATRGMREIEAEIRKLRKALRKAERAGSD